MKKIFYLFLTLCFGLYLTSCEQLQQYIPEFTLPTMNNSQGTVSSSTTNSTTTTTTTTTTTQDHFKDEADRYLERHEVLKKQIYEIKVSDRYDVSRALDDFYSLPVEVRELLNEYYHHLISLEIEINRLEDEYNTTLEYEKEKYLNELDIMIGRYLSSYRENEKFIFLNLVEMYRTNYTFANSLDELYNFYERFNNEILSIKTHAQLIIEEKGTENVRTFPIMAINEDAGGDASSLWTQSWKVLRDYDGQNVHWTPNEWRAFIVLDSNGYVAYYAVMPNSGYGCPGDPMLTHPMYSDYNNNPAYEILDGFGPWESGTDYFQRYKVLIPEGGFAISAHGTGISELVDALSFNKINYVVDGEVQTANNPDNYSKNIALAYDEINGMVVVYKTIDQSAIVNATAELKSYKDFSLYRKAERNILIQYINEAVVLIENAIDEATIWEIVFETKKRMDNVRTHEELLEIESLDKPTTALDVEFTSKNPNSSSKYAWDENTNVVTCTGLEQSMSAWLGLFYAAQSGKQAKAVLVVKGGAGVALSAKLDSSEPNNKYDATTGNKQYKALSEGLTVFTWDLIALDMDSTLLTKLVLWGYDSDLDTINTTFEIIDFYFVPEEDLEFTTPEEVIVLNTREYVGGLEGSGQVPYGYDDVTATLNGEPTKVTALNELDFAQLGYQTITYTAGNLGKTIEVQYLIQDPKSVWFSSLTVGLWTTLRQQAYCHQSHNIFTQTSWTKGQDRIHIYDFSYFAKNYKAETYYSAGLLLVYNHKWELTYFRGVLGGQAFEITKEGTVVTEELAWGTNMLAGAPEVLASMPQGGYVVLVPSDTGSSPKDGCMYNYVFMVQCLLGLDEYVDGPVTEIRLNPYEVKHTYNVEPW